MKLSVVVLAIDEAGHLPGCLASVAPLYRRPGRELVVVLDGRATARVEQIARRHTSRVFRNRFVNFSAQRNFAVSAAEGEWVLFVDPDERLTGPLRAEIEQVLSEATEDGPLGYWVPRRTFMFGHEVRHAGWWPDHQMRLLRRLAARYDESRAVHELPMVPEHRHAYLREPLLHYNYDNWRQFIAKQRYYAAHEAAARHKAGVRPRPRNFVLQPIREFHRRYWTLRGWKDGWLGLLLSAAMAYYNLKMYLMLRALG